GAEEGKPPGLVSVDSLRRIFETLSSANVLGQSSGSSRRVAVSSSRDASVGAESDVRTRTVEAGPGAAHRTFGGQRGSLIGSSDPQRVTRAGRNASQANNYESVFKGMEGLQLENDERTHY
ncbi:Casein kinase 1-like protein 1, variant 6, partial [Lathyrus oleraceus]